MMGLKSCNGFSLQIKLTDVSGLALLLILVSYCCQNTTEENLLLCQSLENHTTDKQMSLTPTQKNMKSAGESLLMYVQMEPY
jgi:hypothetical protein